MDLTACTMTTHGLIPASLQPAPPPGLNGRTAILCPAKSGPWETIVTHIPHHPPPSCILSSPPPLPTEIPKESIIANTDFTTTSLIAKRRLSSKKRRQQQQQQQSHGLSSPNKESHSRLSDDASNRSVTTTIATTTPSSSSHSSCTLTHPVASSMSGVGSHVMAVPAPQYVHVPITASMSLPHNNTVLQLPHQYQLVQQQDTTNKQVLYCKNVKEDSSVSQQQPQSQPNNKPTTSKDFKWSNAHIFIAKRIQEHQKQLKLQEQQKLQHQQHIEQQQKIHQQRIDQQTLHHIQQQQQLLQLHQQQQYALLHVYGYGHHPTPTTANFITLPDIHHQQQPLCVSGLPLVQPPSSQVLGLVPQGLGHQTGGIPLTLAQPTDLQAYIASQGMGGSWVGPTVPIVGSCVVNPLQPAATGLLATTSWVK